LAAQPRVRPLLVLAMDKFIPFVIIPFIGWGVWQYLRKKNDLSPLKKRTFTWAIVFFSLTELGRSFYRPFIYENKIDDYFFADTIGNSFGTITAIFMILTLTGSGTYNDWKIIGIIVFGLIGYEFVNLTKFDINDLIATLIFGTLSIFVYTQILRKYGKSSVAEEDI
jgi:hypothetical protein